MPRCKKYEWETNKGTITAIVCVCMVHPAPEDVVAWMLYDDINGLLGHTG